MKDCEILNEYININEVARIKGLKSNRSLRVEINKGDKSKYISREINTKGGKTYEILIASLESELQIKITDERAKSKQLVTLNNNVVSFEAQKARLEALARIDIVQSLLSFRRKYKTQKEADNDFLLMFNSGQFLPKLHKQIGSVSRSTLYRWVKLFETSGDNPIQALMPGYKYTKMGEYNTKLTPEMIHVFKGFLLLENNLEISKAIAFTKVCLRNRGILDLPSDMTFRRFADKFKKINYGEWVLHRQGEKAFNDLVEPYIERDISKLEVGDVLIADGHTLNFQVINPFTGKPARATLVGFLDWKSTALVGYEIMMSENTQCIASALRNSIINLGKIPKIVYQDNGRAFRAKYFQNCNFDEEGFNGVYANLGIKSVFAKVRNAKAKVIERFFLEFQEEFEKLMISYTGTSIENKPARLMRGEKLHKEMHKRQTGNRVPTIQEVIKYLDKWLKYHNSKPCPNAREMSIKQCLNTVQKTDCEQRLKGSERSETAMPFNASNQAEKIDINILNNLMMKTDTKTIHRNGIKFLHNHYYNEALFGLREPVYIRYSLFDSSKVHVYTLKGEFLCVARQVTKTHPMAYHLGSVKDMEDFKQKIQKHTRLKNKAFKNYLKYCTNEQEQFIEVEPEPPKVEEHKETKKIPKQKKLSAREQQMNRPFFNSDYEKYDWLMKHGCTCEADREWILEYRRTDEYMNLYEADYEENICKN